MSNGPAKWMLGLAVIAFVVVLFAIHSNQMEQERQVAQDGCHIAALGCPEPTPKIEARNETAARPFEEIAAGVVVALFSYRLGKGAGRKPR